MTNLDKTASKMKTVKSSLGGLTRADLAEWRGQKACSPTVAELVRPVLVSLL